MRSVSCHAELFPRRETMFAAEPLYSVADNNAIVCQIIGPNADNVQTQAYVKSLQQSVEKQAIKREHNSDRYEDDWIK